MILFSFKTDIGKREENEDYFGNFRDELFVVADGLGGLPAGEVAARLAVETVISNFAKTHDMKKAFKEANRAVFLEGQDMGTTLVGAVLHLNKLTVANVGDSRCYVLSNDKLKQVTIDHRIGGFPTHFLTRAIGIDSQVDVDMFRQTIKKGDLILLCTDGLTDMISDSVIGKILLSNKSLNDKVSGLIEVALQFGSTDNITVCLIKVV